MPPINGSSDRAARGRSLHQLSNPYNSEPTIVEFWPTPLAEPSWAEPQLNEPLLTELS